jgi:hypothetical protein
MVAREYMPSTMQATASGSNPALVYQVGLSARVRRAGLR